MKSINRGRQTAVAEPADMPGALQEDTKELLLPEGWVLVYYGIPEKNASLRDRLRKIVKAHGLISIDLGGSVYFGVRKPDLDRDLDYVIKKIERETKMKNLVRLLPGNYSHAEASFIKDRVVSNLLVDVDEMEDQVEQLKQALAGNITLMDPKTQKPRDLLSLGESRLRNAKLVLQEAENVLARFAGSKALESESDVLQRRLEQKRAWVESIEQGFKRFAEVERKRRREP